MKPEPSLESLRQATPPPIDRVYARIRKRRTVRMIAASATSVLTAALLLVMFTPSAPGLRDRGMSRAPHVAIEAVAEGGARAPRPLREGGVIAPDERVLFIVRSSLPGEAVLTEHDASGPSVVWPASGSWRIEGEAIPGGNTPLSWRPDRGPGRYRYEATVCPGDSAVLGECGHAELELLWAP